MGSKHRFRESYYRELMLPTGDDFHAPFSFTRGENLQAGIPGNKH